MNPKIAVALILKGFLFLNPLYAQVPTQTIKGTVYDQLSKEPLPGANVIIIGTDPPKGAVTDPDGKFKIPNMVQGRYDLKITFIGYREIILPNVLVNSGKEVILNIELEESFNKMDEVVVVAGRNETNNDMTTVSGRSFSMEEVNRYSGGRSDPARLVANYAGVSVPNDYKNDIVIRGNSPYGVLWRVEDLTIPTPNHFATLAATGTPLTILNPNMLRNSDFFTSAFPAEYGNATAGVFDVGLRNGNADKREHMLQFGLFTGLEAMTEGPIKKGSDASYAIAYRYSFLGLAKEMNLNIGSSALPQYQDLSFKINSGKTKLGTFTLFGAGGLSNIDILHDEVDEDDLFADPKRDIYATSKIGIIGLKNSVRINANTYVSTVIGTTYSGNESSEDTIQTASSNEVNRIREVNSGETRYSVHSYINSKIRSHITVKGGVQADIYNLDLLLRDREFTPEWNYLWQSNDNTSLLSAYVQSQYDITQRLTLNAGIRAQYLTLNDSKSIEPRAGLKYHLNEKSTISAGYGYHSKMQPMNVYFYRSALPDGTYDLSNKELDFTHSQHFVLGYDLLPFTDWRIKLETYYQKLNNVPVSQNPGSFSMVNEGASYDGTEQGFLANEGTGTNYGLELTVEKFFSKGYYGLLTGSFFESKYKGSDGIERNTAFNGNYVYNVLAGKEFKVGKRKQNAFNVDIKLTNAGGRYYTPVDLEASRAAQKEVLKGDEYAFTERYPNFFRMDVKVGFTLNSKKNKVTHSFYYDLQNVTATENVFAQQYNKVTNEVNTAYQIGFLPNFVYRFQF
jgi:hypothetical protein